MIAVDKHAVLRAFYSGESPRLIAIGIRYHHPRITEGQAINIVNDIIIRYGGHFKEFKKSGQVVLPEHEGGEEL